MNTPPCRDSRKLSALPLVGASKSLASRIVYFHRSSLAALSVAVGVVLMIGANNADAQQSMPTVTEPNLTVRTVVSGLNQPIGMAFLGPDDFLVTEKPTGTVKRVVNGAVTETVLDLPVNSGSERGLLGIALHPDFRDNGWVYLYWTESSTGADTEVLAEVGNAKSQFPPGTPQPLGNRVDRFVWNEQAQTLTFDRNIVVLRAFQDDATNQEERGNHNGGVIRFATRAGDDDDDDDDDNSNSPAQLFIIIGDNGRRGVLQNLADGPFGPGVDDDQFGGPEPDNAHLTGVVLRLNDDGSTPSDNPFNEFGASVGGEAGANIQKIFAYGIRNSFGLAVDRRSGSLWQSENGDDAFDEINRIEPGQNGGWIQVMGPLERIAQLKEIETTPGEMLGLQQDRWPATNFADSPDEALARMVQFPGAHYADPQFSWQFATAPAAIGFLEDRSLGRDFQGDLFVGASAPTLLGGQIFRFDLAENRQRLELSDPRLADRVADNEMKFSAVESDSLLFGSGFGVTTDIQTGPEGGLFIVSSSTGNVYEIVPVEQ